MGDNDAPLLLDATRLVWRRWSGVRPTGIDRICLAWLDHFGNHAQAVIILRRQKLILPWAASQALFALLAAPDVNGPGQFRAGLAALVLRRGFSLARRLPGRGRIWLNAGHTGLDVPALAQWVRGAGVRPVYLVHDLIPITHPQHCRDGESTRHSRRMTCALATAAGIVANSAHTLASLSEFAASQALPLPPSVVAWPGTPQLPPAPATSPVPERPHFVMLGTIEGRKNHQMLLDMWAGLASRSPLPPRLELIGRRGWQAETVFAALDAGVAGVVEAGALDDAGIAARLAGARALLFPSLAEGYGLPLVEALAAGVPVIASDLPVFEEIGQGVPDLLPPDDPAAWAAAVCDYARPDSPRRAAQLARLGTFVAPDWPSHFAAIDRLLNQLHRPPPDPQIERQ